VNAPQKRDRLRRRSGIAASVAAADIGERDG
jgi:hypothetical protein